MTELCASMTTAPVLHTFVLYLIAFCSRLETACNVISGRFVGHNDADKALKVRDPRLNRSREISPEAVIFDGFFHTNSRPEVVMP